MRNATKNLSQDRRSPGRDLNPGHHEHEVGALATRQRRSIFSSNRVGAEHVVEVNVCLLSRISS
jgi:hypothetical protein